MTPMRTITDHGVQVDVCPSCNGRWYDLGELRNFVVKTDVLEKLLKEGLMKPSPSNIKCPRCDGAMTNGGLASQFLRVDMCNSCKGIWLDASELRVLTEVLGLGKK